jgi:AcrR family transcriptional regulator
VGQLPLGVQRRVAFTEALAHRPSLLVLDEPTSGVDPLGRARLWETIRTVVDDGAGVLVTTHHMDEAEECDRLVFVANGRVVAEGSIAAIVADAQVTEAARRRFADHGYDRATIRSVAADAGVDPAPLRHLYGSKEQLFVAAMRLPAAPSEVLAGLADRAGRDRDHLGQTLIRAVLSVWETPEGRAAVLGLLRSAVSNEQAAVMLREFVRRTILGRIVAVLDARRLPHVARGQPDRRPCGRPLRGTARAGRFSQPRGPGRGDRPDPPALPHRRTSPGPRT